jgi:hypothetical protein
MRGRLVLKTHPGVIAAFVIIGAAIAFVGLTNTRPSYDAFGWLVWGRQALHWNLDTNGAPSWKPLPFLFTFPYALAGHSQMWLWLVTETAGAIAGAWFAARIAYRLTGETPARPYAPFAAAVFAAVGVLALQDFYQLILIGNVDPLIMSLTLAGVDAHLSKRPKLAFAALTLAALGRPEAWPFAAVYAVWLWRHSESKRTRAYAVAGVALIPLLWFGVPALTAKSWFISGDLALNSKNVLHGDKFTGVLSRFFGLFEWPMDVAAGLALVIAAIRRDRTMLLLTVAAAVWVAIEIAFAYHGWSAVPRYLFEPAAVIIAVAGAGVGRAFAAFVAPRLLIRLAGPAAAAALLVGLVPPTRAGVRVAHSAIDDARARAKQLDRLEDVISRFGGGKRIRQCGQPVTFVGLQSTLAWELRMNVGYVGFKPGKEISGGKPIVLFRPHGLGWEVRPIHIPAGRRSSCAELWVDTAFS